MVLNKFCLFGMYQVRFYEDFKTYSSWMELEKKAPESRDRLISVSETSLFHG